ncbi:hypothetical protein [Stenotrophomonas sp. 364]|uniref:hypothetical protein n=1 Tax=Stenotrophomonas sp. 364 TaxID=2691571 RepID=UPI0013165A13|nr:hypothetical protein [Stenotrophomonas sp. 364]QHB72917.1 hypothetical protein GQ674_17190 [Stenotrophomonas sp. 364]
MNMACLETAQVQTHAERALACELENACSAAMRILTALDQSNGVVASSALVRVVPDATPLVGFLVSLRLHEAGLVKIAGAGPAQRIELTDAGRRAAQAATPRPIRRPDGLSFDVRLHAVLQDLEDALNDACDARRPHVALRHLLAARSSVAKAITGFFPQHHP